MTKLLGYVFLGLGVLLLIGGINQLGIYIKQPETFPIYDYLVNLPEAERTIQTKAGNMLLPAGVFKISGLFSIILAGFLLLSLVRLLMSTGAQMMSSNTRDVAKQLVAEMRKMNRESHE
ncbi:MAG: hypothetical protein MI808_19500 [Pseudomonadales bacterium]|nr:hypothetical protein [Pseudomonadales bacterium]